MITMPDKWALSIKKEKHFCIEIRDCESKWFVDELKIIVSKLKSSKEESELERLFLQLDFPRSSTRALIYLNLH